jgi:3-oxoadipate enol-lactonase
MPQKISVNGIDIAYEDEGPKDGPVVVMSHSLSANRRMWDPQVPALVDRYRVVRYDTRGHGDTSVPEGAYTLDQLADDAIGLIRALDLGRVHFVGLSMGGMVGQTVALKAPEVLESLVLCDTSSGYPGAGRSMWEERIANARKGGMAGMVDATIERWFSPGFVARDPGTIGAVRDMILATDVNGYIGCSHAISKLDTTPRLGEIAVPTLILVGEDDPGTPVAMHEVLRDGIAGSELVIFPVARHLSNMEVTDAFNGTLRRFLDAH